MNVALRPIIEKYGEGTVVGFFAVEGPTFRILLAMVALASTLSHAADRRPAAEIENLIDGVAIARSDDQALAWDGAHQQMELSLNGGKIRKDVCVIVFKIVQHSCSWSVMNELRASIKIACVVFVSLHNEERRFT